MEADDSCVIVGGRKSLPQVYIATEAETGSSNLRHRYSSGSSSAGTPNWHSSQPISTSTPQQKTPIKPSFGTPGLTSTGYGSFQPTSYTDAYVPPLSLRNENYTRRYRYSPPRKSEESIRIDSGYGRSNSYTTFPHSQSFSSDANTSLWDTFVSSPVQNLRQKLRGRPSYLDEGHSRSLKIQPQQFLACLILVIIITSIGFAFLISYKHFNSDERNEDRVNSRNRAIQFERAGKDQEGSDFENKLKKANNEEASIEISVKDVEKLGKDVENPSEEIDYLDDPTLDPDLNFLLEDDVTFEEVEKLKIALEEKSIALESRSTVVKESTSEVEVAVMKKLADFVELLVTGEESVGAEAAKTLEGVSGIEGTTLNMVVKNSGAEEELFDEVKPTKKKSRNANPLTKAVPVMKKSKAKSTKLLNVVETEVDKVENIQNPAQAVDYPDDPTFREGVLEGRVRRDDTNDEVVFGDKFRKYKDDREGGFRKQEEDVGDGE
eukprot:GFUD01123120.1.p1 GENE.GFUD01123120.1~~GFUD01123120.1.p1  ORF type:complete len:492 (-),score=112.95 GFUD01123120.1:192-1667(-)